MQFRSTLLIIASILLCTSVRGNTTLTSEQCRIIVKDLERMSNLNPQDVEDKAPVALDQLREGETLPLYFIAYNIYVENLFNKGKIDKARMEIERMVDEAFGQTNQECKVIALRTQGQFYYKLGLYERAAACFRNAMEMCPRYDSKLLESYFTWSSTLFWLVQADIHTGRIEEAEHWIGRMEDMMEWLETKGDKDRIGYKPVMIRGLKAKIELRHGHTDAAAELLSQCPQYILADIPDRAYVEYYVAKMLLYVRLNKYEDALPLLDRLIEMHINDYKPIAAEYLYQKGLALGHLGRYEECSKTLEEYIELKDLVNKVALAQQLDELTTRYEVEKLQHESDNMRRKLAIVLAICIALAIIVALIIVSRRRLSRKNKTLARNISELSRLSRETPATAPNTADTEAHPSSAELVKTGNRIVEFINRTKCYRRMDCSRDTIKDGLGVSERTLAKAIVAATGLSFVNYINQLRLNVSIEMLEDNPEMTISDISTACGFGSVRQFQRLFKQHYDLSPSAYREARNSASKE